MRDRKHFPLALATMILAACLCLAGIHLYRAQFVHIDNVRYEQSIIELDLSGAPIEDLEALREFPGLRKLNLRGTGLTVEEYETLRTWLPDCEILWEVPFQGSYYPNDRKTLTVTTLSARDVALLDYLPDLQFIYAQDCHDYTQLTALRQRRPDCRVYYSIEVGGETYSYKTTTLTIPGDDPDTLSGLIPFFPNLRSVTLTPPLAGIDRILALRESFPDIAFTWQLEIKGVHADELTTTLDLTGIPMTVEEMETLIPYLPNLSYVDMTNCGISNEEMEEMNLRHENIKIVWTVTLGRWFRIRTDATWFMPVKYDFYPRGDDLYNLRYCHDIIALDIGHMRISNCDFVAYMPHIKYLLLADTSISDLTPLTGLTELIYLELFQTRVTDYSPLLTLTALEDLNLHYTHGDPEIIAQMTWLKNLWWNNTDAWQLSWKTKQMLREALPDCHCEFTCTSSTGAGWRELPNYYAQRDIFGMHYMKG